MLFDSSCVVCGARRGPVCDDCGRGLVPLGRLAGSAPLHGCRCAFVLDDRSRPVIAAFKYRRQRALGSWLAAAMAPLVPTGADALTWIPATPARRRQRGYDQSRELARALAAHTGVPAIGLLRRARRDRRQTGRSRTARLAGPALAARRASPGFVVLVDDVVTTGSSLRVGAAVLRRAGAERVVGVVAAATPLADDRRRVLEANPSRIPAWK